MDPRLVDSEAGVPADHNDTNRGFVGGPEARIEPDEISNRTIALLDGT